MCIHELTVKNCSGDPVRFALFQKAPDLGEDVKVSTLVWFSRYSYPGTAVEFAWETDYSALWCRSEKKLTPGVICGVDQQVHMDPGGINSVTLTFNKNRGVFEFGMKYAGAGGAVFTRCDSTIPDSNKEVDEVTCIGIGMCGSPCFVTETRPDTIIKWIPEADYYLVAGDFKTGEVINPAELMGKAVRLPFNGTHEEVVCFNSDYRLVVEKVKRD